MKPNTILGRYLMKQILWNFLGVLLMVIGIVYMFEIIDLLRRVADRPDVGFGFVLEMAFTKLPNTLEIVFPFVMMIAAMITFWRLSKNSEFVIIRAAGVSVWGFLAPVLFVVFLVGVVNVTLLNPVSSYLNEVYETLNYRFKTKNPKAVLFSDKGLWIREAGENGNVLVMQAKSVHQQDDDTLFLYNVDILELDKASQIIRQVKSFMAVLKNKQFELRDVIVFEPGKKRLNLNKVSYKTSIDVERIKENFVDPTAISFWQLPDTINFYKKSGFSPLKHQMRFMSLLASPFLLCVMVLVAAVFALRSNMRKGGVMVLIIGGVASGFVVYFASQVIYAFGLNGYIPSIMAVWTPILITALVSVSALLKQEDG